MVFSSVFTEQSYCIKKNLLYEFWLVVNTFESFIWVCFCVFYRYKILFVAKNPGYNKQILIFTLVSFFKYSAETCETDPKFMKKLNPWNENWNVIICQLEKDLQICLFSEYLLQSKMNLTKKNTFCHSNTVKTKFASIL